MVSGNEKIEYELNSELIKVYLAKYYRGRQYEYVATEYDFKDIIISDKKNIIEIEVKISISDLYNESKDRNIYRKNKEGKRVLDYIRKTKTNKHNKYKECKSGTPNKFYIAMPYELALKKDAQEYISALNINYGIIGVSHHYSKGLKRYIPDIYHVKVAKYLHNNKVSEKILNSIVKRLSSENIGLREKLIKLKLDNKKAT